MKPALSPWQKIVRAGKRNTGLKLTADEVWRLARDGAIETRAALDDEEQAEQADASAEAGR